MDFDQMSTSGGTSMSLERTPQVQTLQVQTTEELPLGAKIVLGVTGVFALASTFLIPIAAIKYLRS